MKYILILLATITMTAQAGTCEDLSDISKALMTARQNGASMLEVWNIPSSKHLKPYAHTKIKQAWSEPRYSTYEYQQKAITDFTNQAFLECVQVMNK